MVLSLHIHHIWICIAVKVKLNIKSPMGCNSVSLGQAVPDVLQKCNAFRMLEATCPTTQSHFQKTVTFSNSTAVRNSNIALFCLCMSCRCGGAAPCIVNICTRWRSVINCIPWSPYLWGEEQPLCTEQKEL